MTFDPAPAAAALLAARREARPAGPLPAQIAPADIAQAAAVQRALAEATGDAMPGGFKLGATGTRMQSVLGLSGPAAGFMAARDLHPSGVTLPYATFRGLALECELAVRLARDLPGPCSLAEAADAVGTLGAAIEVVENRYGRPPIGDLVALGTPTLVADQVYHRAAILGDGVADWRGLDLRAIAGVISLDGVECDRGLGAELLGDPLRGLAWLAGSLEAAAFGGLKAGMIVLLGSVTPPVFPTGPARALVAFAGLPEVVLNLS